MSEETRLGDEDEVVEKPTGEVQNVELGVAGPVLDKGIARSVCPCCSRSTAIEKEIVNNRKSTRNQKDEKKIILFFVTLNLMG